MTLYHDPDLINIPDWLSVLHPTPSQMGSCSQLPSPNPKSQLFLLETADWVEAGMSGSSPLRPDREVLFNIPFKAVDVGLAMESLQPGTLLSPVPKDGNTFPWVYISSASLESQTSVQPSQRVGERSLLMATL